MNPCALLGRMRLILLALLALAPTVLAAGEVVTFELASEGVLGGQTFNLAFITPATVTRSGATSDVSATIFATGVQARYIVDGATSFIPVTVTATGQGADTSGGVLLVDVVGSGAGQGFRTSVRMTGAEGTFVGPGTIGHGAQVGALAALVEID